MSISDSPESVELSFDIRDATVAHRLNEKLGAIADRSGPSSSSATVRVQWMLHHAIRSSDREVLAYLYAAVWDQPKYVPQSAAFLLPRMPLLFLHVGFLTVPGRFMLVCDRLVFLERLFSVGDRGSFKQRFSFPLTKLSALRWLAIAGWYGVRIGNPATRYTVAFTPPEGFHAPKTLGAPDSGLKAEMVGTSAAALGELVGGSLQTAGNLLGDLGQFPAVLTDLRIARRNYKYWSAKIPTPSTQVVSHNGCRD